MNRAKIKEGVYYRTLVDGDIMQVGDITNITGYPEDEWFPVQPEYWGLRYNTEEYTTCKRPVGFPITLNLFIQSHREQYRDIRESLCRDYYGAEVTMMLKTAQIVVSLGGDEVVVIYENGVVDVYRTVTITKLVHVKDIEQ